MSGLALLTQQVYNCQREAASDAVLRVLGGLPGGGLQQVWLRPLLWPEVSEAGLASPQGRLLPLRGEDHVPPGPGRCPHCYTAHQTGHQDIGGEASPAGEDTGQCHGGQDHPPGGI